MKKTMQIVKYSEFKRSYYGGKISRKKTVNVQAVNIQANEAELLMDQNNYGAI